MWEVWKGFLEEAEPSLELREEGQFLSGRRGKQRPGVLATACEFGEMQMV